MIDTEKNYVGKIVQVKFSYKEYQKEATGIVLEQVNTPIKFSLNLILLNGETKDIDSLVFQIHSISSVRLEKGVRDALVAFYDAKSKQTAFLKNFWKEKNVLENNVQKAYDNLKAQTGQLSFSDFSDKVEALFSAHFPSFGASYKPTYFSFSFASNNEFGISQCQQIEKYATPEKYPFLYCEYDNPLQIYADAPSFKQFCARNAPKEIPQLKGKASSTVDASVGDKNTLIVRRTYHFPLKYGMSQKTIDYLESFLSGKEKSKPSLDSVLDSAASRCAKNSSEQKIKTKDKELE